MAMMATGAVDQPSGSSIGLHCTGRDAIALEYCTVDGNNRAEQTPEADEAKAGPLFFPFPSQTEAVRTQAQQ